MTTFAQLPAVVQAALTASGQCLPGDFVGVNFSIAPAPSHAGIYIAPQLCYDFHESNFALHAINLDEVASLDVGPAMATAYVKADPSLPAYLVVDPDGGDGEFQVYECL
jgi:hypothetical protein